MAPTMYYIYPILIKYNHKSRTYMRIWKVMDTLVGIYLVFFCYNSGCLMWINNFEVST